MGMGAWRLAMHTLRLGVGAVVRDGQMDGWMDGCSSSHLPS